MATTTPPAPALGIFAPPPLGKTPVVIGQLAPNKDNGIGSRATHFTGPVVSGPKSIVAIYGQETVAGSAVLALNLKIDYSMGNFNLPMQFPLDAIIIGTASLEYDPYAAAPTITVGQTNGAADIAAPVIPGPPEFAIGQLPLWNAVAPAKPFEAWLNVTGNAGTAGGIILSILYVRIARAWN